MTDEQRAALIKEFDARAGQYWVVVLNERRTREIGYVHREGLYFCGDEERWDPERDNFTVEWIRKIRL